VTGGRPTLGLLRRVNVSVARHASIQANTIPSGHSAGAVAVALAVGVTMPIAGAVYMMIALVIAVATVVGRYHYTVDSVLGVFVAVVVWAAV